MAVLFCLLSLQPVVFTALALNFPLLLSDLKLRLGLSNFRVLHRVAHCEARRHRPLHHQLQLLRQGHRLPNRLWHW